MKRDSLIQQLFAIERAIGYVTKDELRSMVIDAQEAALAAQTTSLHEIETLRRRLEESHRFGTRPSSRFAFRRLFRSAARAHSASDISRSS